jgi:hypothetical protein
MNIYDTKTIHCITCGKFIGEIDYNAQVVLPRCGNCSNPRPHGDDSLLYLASRIGNKIKSRAVA